MEVAIEFDVNFQFDVQCLDLDLYKKHFLCFVLTCLQVDCGIHVCICHDNLTHSMQGHASILAYSHKHQRHVKICLHPPTVIVLVAIIFHHITMEKLQRIITSHQQKKYNTSTQNQKIKNKDSSSCHDKKTTWIKEQRLPTSERPL